jgi:hypothetical protein
MIDQDEDYFCEINSWKPETCVDGVWTSNGVCFATCEESEIYLIDLGMRWKAVERARSMASLAHPTYRWENGRAVPIKPGDVS